MYIMKTHIGREKRNALNTFTTKQSFMSALIHNNYKQKSKIDHKIAANKFIHRTCGVP